MAKTKRFNVYGPANPGKKTPSRNRSVQTSRSRKVVMKKTVETRSTFRTFPKTLFDNYRQKTCVNFVYTRGNIKQQKNRKQGSGNWRTFLSQRTSPRT